MLYEPEPLLVPVLGEVVLGELVPLEPVELPLPMLEVPPDELDLLKNASHSAREICPSLFVSTSEKLGCDELLDALELPPLADGEEDEDDGVLDEVDGLLDDEDDWATASDDSANITAAAVTLRVLGMRRSPYGWEKLPPSCRKPCAALARTNTRLKPEFGVRTATRETGPPPP